VLVVDDQLENRELMQRFLEAHGYHVVTVSTGQEALDSVAAVAPDAILLDLVMPGLSGFDVCHRLKRDPETHHIPIIMITGVSEHEANLKALEMGANDFITRPFDGVLLEARLKSSVRSKLLQDQLRRYQGQLVEANASLEARIHERTAQILRTQQVTVFSLSKLAESRDTETGAHLERMRCYAREAAKELALKPKYDAAIDSAFVESIYFASPLHDIGKVGIPDQILLKPGKLTSEEFDIMKAHARIGGDTLKAADTEAGGNSYLGMGRDIAYYHHERWDGTGYPFGLGGEDIPIEARIVALGDVYDALRSKRPYKEPFSHEKARGIILEGRGNHFDPEIVDAFLAREQQFTRIHDSFQDPDTPPLLEQFARQLEALSQ
jgi:putative two-component system response regulator